MFRRRHKLQPLRYSRQRKRSASGQFRACLAVLSQRIFRPARKATFPSSTISVSGPA